MKEAKKHVVKAWSAGRTLTLLLCCLRLAAQDKPDPTDIFAENKLFAKTINIGFAIGSTDPGSELNITSADLARIKKAGFTAVRLPIQWVTHMDTLTNIIEKVFFTKIDGLVAACRNLDLAVILVNQVDEDCMNQPQRRRLRFLHLWEQLSFHYKDQPQTLAFEILAEPHGNLEPLWNEFLRQALVPIRQYNCTRAVLIGPVWSNRPQKLSELSLPPDDQHIIVTFHQYSPVSFTMQGETWFPFGNPIKWLGTQWPLAGDEEKVIALMDAAVNWARINKRPLFMGEFGVSSHADSTSAARFITFHCEQAEKRGISWGYWSCLGPTFNIFTPAGEWKPLLLNALLAKSPGL